MRALNYVFVDSLSPSLVSDFSGWHIFNTQKYRLLHSLQFETNDLENSSQFTIILLTRGLFTAHIRLVF